MRRGSQITGTGIGFPNRVMTNTDFESFLDTSDEWIASRTGIRERRVADRENGETTLSLAEIAARQALKNSGVSASDLGLVVVGTVTPESIMPSTAAQLQARLNAGGFAFDLQAACSGWMYGCSIADQFIRTGQIDHALIVGAETLSTLVNWQDRSTCVLFGDGAGATVLSATESDRRVIATRVFSDGHYGPLLQIPHGYGKVPPWAKEYRLDQHKIQMAGREIFKHAVRSMTGSAEALLKENSMTTSDLDFVFLHQANIRIIETCMKSLGIPKEKTYINVDKFGNTSSATLPVCLHEAFEKKLVKKGDTVLFSTFGGGLTWGSALVRL